MGMFLVSQLSGSPIAWYSSRLILTCEVKVLGVSLWDLSLLLRLASLFCMVFPIVLYAKGPMWKRDLRSEASLISRSSKYVIEWVVRPLSAWIILQESIPLLSNTAVSSLDSGLLFVGALLMGGLQGENI